MRQAAAGLPVGEHTLAGAVLRRRSAALLCWLLPAGLLLLMLLSLLPLLLLLPKPATGTLQLPLRPPAGAAPPQLQPALGSVARCTRHTLSCNRPPTQRCRWLCRHLAGSRYRCRTTLPLFFSLFKVLGPDDMALSAYKGGAARPGQRVDPGFRTSGAVLCIPHA
jgi:hypothetical protein